MRTAYFQCFSGISGDMILGSLVDAGLDFDELLEELDKLNISEYYLENKKVTKNNITGTKIDVVVKEKEKHRKLQDILDIIKRSTLPDLVKIKSEAVFTKLAAAEAAVHNTTKGEVHFHEVGSLDAVIDVVGAVSGLELMGIEKIYSSPLHVGTGFTECSHGVIPIPSPAAVELLKGIPVYSQGIEKELVTPTGAAVISTLCDGFGSMPDMTVELTGYGAGSWELEIPNLLRLMIGRQHNFNLQESRFLESDNVNQAPAVMIEANIDDMSPEFYDYILNKLFSLQVHDVFLKNLQMKKNRPGTMLCVLTDSSSIEDVLDVIFKETTTIGVRTYNVTKHMLPYEVKLVNTEYGIIKVKVAYLDSNVVTAAPEYEDCCRAAKKSGFPVKTIYDSAKEKAKEFLE